MKFLLKLGYYRVFHKKCHSVSQKITLYSIKNVSYFLYKMTLFNNFNKFQNSIFNKTIINDFSNQSNLLLTQFIYLI